MEAYGTTIQNTGWEICSNLKVLQNTSSHGYRVLNSSHGFFSFLWDLKIRNASVRTTVMYFAAIQFWGHFLGFKLSARQVQRCHFARQGRASAVKRETINRFSCHQSLRLLYKRVLTRQHSAGVVKGVRPGRLVPRSLPVEGAEWWKTWDLPTAQDVRL